MIAWILATLHFVFCMIFFALYFSSADLQRGMAFVLFVPFDPWIVPLSRLPLADSILATILTILGTLQWWCIGWLIAHGSRLLLGRHQPK